MHGRAKAAASHMRHTVVGHSVHMPGLSDASLAQLQIIFCPFCEQPQACSSSKEGFKSAALNCNTAFSHLKTCSARGTRSVTDAFNDVCARQPGGKAWAHGARGEEPRLPDLAPPRPLSGSGSGSPAPRPPAVSAPPRTPQSRVASGWSGVVPTFPRPRSTPPLPPQPVGEYEAQRNANVKENMAYLASLELGPPPPGQTETRRAGDGGQQAEAGQPAAAGTPRAGEGLLPVPRV